MKELRAQRILTRAFFAVTLTFFSTTKAAIAKVDDSESDKTKALLRTAYLQMIKGEFQLAAENHKLAVRTDRDSIAARRNLGYSLLKLGDYNAASEQLHYLLNMTEPTVFDMCLLGEACLQSGHYSLAVCWFSEALKHDSKLVNAKIGLAKAVTAGKNKNNNLATSQTSSTDENSPELARVEQNLYGSAASTATNSPSNLSTTIVFTKRTPLGNNQTHNAWEAYKGLQRK